MNESHRHGFALTRRRLLCALPGLIAASPRARADDLPRTAGPYVPTPSVIVERMLELAKVGPEDFVVDLGSGDGRMVRTAARVYGASGFGVDIDPALVSRSNAEAKKEGLAGRATFYQRDVFQADVRKATVVTLYVLPDMMVGLRPKLLSELRPGARIVSHDYHFREWHSDERWSFDVPEKRDAVGFSSTTIYLWIVPAHVAGRWRIEVAGQEHAPAFTLDLHQLFQTVRGTARLEGRTVELLSPRLRGSTLEFKLPPAQTDGEHAFQGHVAGDTMQGEVAWGAGVLPRNARWKATRVQTFNEPLAQ
jgi:hypothetical protein